LKLFHPRAVGFIGWLGFTATYIIRTSRSAESFKIAKGSLIFRTLVCLDRLLADLGDWDGSVSSNRSCRQANETKLSHCWRKRPLLSAYPG